MKIPTFSDYLDLWRVERDAGLRNHIGPLSVTAATTLLVGMVWGKHQALYGVCVAVVVYPLTRQRVCYLMFLDLHETTYAVAVVGIQLCSMQFPTLAQWRLLMSVALAYAFTIRGMRIRQALQNQGTEINNLQSLNSTLGQQTAALSDNTKRLKEALTTLYCTLGLQEHSIQALASTEHEEVCQKMAALIELCEKLSREGNLQEQTQKIDANIQHLQAQTAQLEANNGQLEKVIQKLRAAEAQFQQLIQQAGQGEAQVRKCLEQFHTWLLQLDSAS